MSATPVQTGNFVAEFERVAASLPGDAAMSGRRRGAIERFRALGLPDTRREAWKYTNVTPLARTAYRAAAREDADVPASDLVPLRSDAQDAIRVVFVNGHQRDDLSVQGPLPAGLTIRSVAAVLRETPDEVVRAEADKAPPFIVLNEAFCSEGALIAIADGTAVELPIELIFITAGDADNLAVYPRVLVQAGAGAQARIIEIYRGSVQTARFTNAVTQIRAGNGARIEHYLVQDEAARTFHIGHLDVEQARSSVVVSHSIALGGLLARRDIEVRLQAEQADVTLNGLYLAGGRQHIDHHTRIDHLAPHTRSEEFYRGILSQHGRAVFNGKVVVHPGAFKTDAQQANHNLLLSKDAEIDTKPELQIHADDVKCAHGATVGQLDADALFYLRARGLDEPAARGLLTYAFAADVIARIGVESLRRDLARRIAGQLPETGLVREFL
ncbi:MAG: Fe-S cluster assembly protein SufD [Chromatiales bacterium]